VPTSRPARRPLCRTCGYDRSGLAEDAACPECGGVPGPAGPQWVAPLPSKPALLWRLFWPVACLPLLLLAFLFLGRHAWMFVLFFTAVGLFVPIYVAGSVAFDCVPHRRREGVFIRLLAVGWGVNLTAFGMFVILLLYGGGVL